MSINSLDIKVARIHKKSRKWYETKTTKGKTYLLHRIVNMAEDSDVSMRTMMRMMMRKKMRKMGKMRMMSRKIRRLHKRHTHQDVPRTQVVNHNLRSIIMKQNKSERWCLKLSKQSCKVTTCSDLPNICRRHTCQDSIRDILFHLWRWALIWQRKKCLLLYMSTNMDPLDQCMAPTRRTCHGMPVNWMKYIVVHDSSSDVNNPVKEKRQL